MSWSAIIANLQTFKPADLFDVLIIAFVIFIIPHIGNWIIERIVMFRCLLGDFIRS